MVINQVYFWIQKLLEIIKPFFYNHVSAIHVSISDSLNLRNIERI